MNQAELDILNITQQVLRNLTIALAAVNASDLGKLGMSLEAAAANQTLDPMAQQMLADLAAGVTGLHAAGLRKQ